MSNARDFFKIKNNDRAFGYNYYGNPKPIKDYTLLDKVTFSVLGITPQTIKDQLLGMGRDLIDPTTGKEYTEEFYESLLDQAVANTEKELDIVIRPRVVKEPVDYNQTEFNSYMFLRLAQRPIIQVDDLQLGYNNQTLFKIPDEWLKVNHLYGQIEVQPNALVSTPNLDFQSLNVMPLLPMFGLSTFSGYNTQQFMPQALGCTYIAGMLPMAKEDRGVNRSWYIHPDLIAYIAKKATIEVLERWGRTILGAGIASYNISIDAINTGVNSTQSAENTGSTADIKLLQQDMKDIKHNLINYYGQNMGVLS